MYSQFVRGSVWRKWDLQVCTNHYCNYNGANLNKEALERLAELTGLPKASIQSDHKQLSNDDYARLFVEYLAHFTDLSVVAIANHNTGEGIQAILDYLVNRKAGAGGRYAELFIFPGVEIGANDKCHIIAVFNPETDCANKHVFDHGGRPTGTLNWDQYIDAFLRGIGLTAQRFQNGKPANSPGKSTQDILDLCEEWDFLPVFPHIDIKAGWYSELPENLRHLTFRHRNFGIVDSKSIGKNQDLRTILNGRNLNYAHVERSERRTRSVDVSLVY